MKILRDFMSSPVIGVAPDANAYDVAKIMAEKKIGCVLIEEQGEYTGIITGTDLVKRVLAKGLDPAKTRAEDIASSPLLTMDYLLTVDETRDKLLRKNIERLVVTEAGKVVGIFTMNDMVRT